MTLDSPSCSKKESHEGPKYFPLFDVLMTTPFSLYSTASNMVEYNFIVRMFGGEQTVFKIISESSNIIQRSVQTRLTCCIQHWWRVLNSWPIIRLVLSILSLALRDINTTLGLSTFPRHVMAWFGGRASSFRAFNRVHGYFYGIFAILLCRTDEL